MAKKYQYSCCYYACGRQFLRHMIRDTTIKDLFAEFLSEQPNMLPATKGLYRITFEYFIHWTTRTGRDIHQTRQSDFIAYRDYLRERPARGPSTYKEPRKISASTIDNYLSPVRKFFGWLNREGYYPNHIGIGVTSERDRGRMFIKQALSIEQIYELLDRTNGDTTLELRNYAIIMLMSFSGLRCREVCGLNFGDMLTSTSGVIRLQIQRKGSREKGGLITISTDIHNALQTYFSLRDHISDAEPMFVNHSPRNRNARINPRSLSRIIKGQLRNIGLDNRKYSAHSLRHTSATLAVLAGSEVWEVQKMLGHASPQQTERYIHLLGMNEGPEGHATDKIAQYAKKHKKPTKIKRKK